MPEYSIAGNALRATIRSLGAEPVSIAHASVGEVLWQAGPVWPRHAPVLFPIVGELADNTYRHAGNAYRMERHGFARNCEFALADSTPHSVSLMLVDDATTRAVFPFPFHFEIAYAIVDDALVVTYMVHNPGMVTLPASVGAHPAFRWPLAAGVPKTAHVLTFAQDEPEPIWRLDHNLLATRTFPTPIRGHDLHLDPALFEADAVILNRPKSTSVRYHAAGADNAPAIDLAWSGFAQLGIWSKAPGDFVCIEPWYGYASPRDFEGDFLQKPGLALIAPGDSRTFSLRIRVEVAR